MCSTKPTLKLKNVSFGYEQIERINYFVFIKQIKKMGASLIGSDVKELVQECVGGAALQQCKSKIQTYGEQTSSTLKKHVYANYMQFIETAKEISRKRDDSCVTCEKQIRNPCLFLDLESEMYQLSHLLIEQRNILSTLREQSSTDDTKGVLMGDGPENGNVSNYFILLFICTILNLTDPCTIRFIDAVDKDELQNKKALAAIQESLIGFTGNLENKTFLHDGALIELDPENYRPICRVFFFLLNDLLIVGKVKHDKYVMSTEISSIN